MEGVAGPSPFSVRREDALALSTSRGFRILKSYLEDNVDSTFCSFHSSDPSTHSTYLLHRAIIHALIAPVIRIHTRATELATRARKVGATVCDDEEGTSDEDSEDEGPCHSSRDADLELFFADAARDAYVALDGLVSVDERWCAGAGCPGCLTEKALTDEPALRLLLGALSLAEAHPVPSTVSSSSPSSSEQNSPQTKDGSKALLFAPLVVDSGLFASCSPINNDDSAYDSDTNYASSIEDSAYGGSSFGSSSGDDSILCRVTSTTSSLATSVAGSPSTSICASPQLAPTSHPSASTLRPAFSSTNSSRTQPAPAAEKEPASLPDMLFFRSSMLSAIAADPFWGPHVILELVERGWGLARGLEALVEACAELEEILADVEDTPPESESPGEQSTNAIAAKEEVNEEEEDVPIGDLPVAWVDELDLVDSPRRATFPCVDAQFSPCQSPQILSDKMEINDTLAALRRIAASWHLQPVWTRTQLWEALPNAAERRALVEMLILVGDDEGWGGERHSTVVGRRQRRRSWHC